jgi:4-diphosphocytidyl-2-C-methyl-D-erythritol kinase
VYYTGSQIFEPESGTDLVTRAARRLSEACGGGYGAQIIVNKRIPVAAGLGGGSADAAAALRGLQRLWDVSLPDAEMAELALGLGADVPACLGSAPVRVSGIGEKLMPAPALPDVPLLLANPGVPVPTGAVFAGLGDDAIWEADPLTGAPADTAALADALRDRHNDLEEPALRLVPEIGDVLNWLIRQPHCLHARMSGSGATCFGIYADAAALADAMAAAVDDDLGWWFRPARFAPPPADACR